MELLAGTGTDGAADARSATELKDLRSVLLGLGTGLIGSAAGVEHGGEVIGERRLAAVHSGEMQQADIDAAGLARLEPGIQRLPGAAEDQAREQLVAEH